MNSGLTATRSGRAARDRCLFPRLSKAEQIHYLVLRYIVVWSKFSILPGGLSPMAMTTTPVTAPSSSGQIDRVRALSRSSMRRLLKEIASSGQVTGDTTTIEDYSVLAKLSV